MPKTPPSLEMLRADLTQIHALAKRYGAQDLRVFGSVARGEQGPGSDVDLLINMRPPSSLFDLMDLERALTELFGVPFDIHTENGLSPFIRDRILEEAVFL